MNEIPVIYNDKAFCCGCGACATICPCHAISMIEDDEGFEYPYINQMMCVKCYRCIKVCPVKKKKGENN